MSYILRNIFESFMTQALSDYIHTYIFIYHEYKNVHIVTFVKLLYLV